MDWDCFHQKGTFNVKASHKTEVARRDRMHKCVRGCSSKPIHKLQSQYSRTQKNDRQTTEVQHGKYEQGILSNHYSNRDSPSLLEPRDSGIKHGTLANLEPQISQIYILNWSSSRKGTIAEQSAGHQRRVENGAPDK